MPRQYRRGVRFQKSTVEARQRVIDAVNNNDDFIVVAGNNGISRRTAYRIAASGVAQYRPRGGQRRQIVTAAMEDALVQMLSNNPLSTLNEYKAMLLRDFETNVSTQTISRHLDGQGYTIKKLHVEPEGMNSDVNKLKRRQYADYFMQGVADNKLFYFVDDTNYNLFCKRTNGRSCKGDRCTV